MSLKRNTIANLLGQGWTALMGLVFVPIYIEYLGIEAWGLVGFMSMLQAWLTLLDSGLTPTLSREMTRFHAGQHNPQSIRNLLRSLEIVYLFIAISVITIVWLTAPWLAKNWLVTVDLPQAAVVNAINTIAIVLATRMVEQVYRGAIQGLQKQVWLNISQSILSTLRWGGVIGVLIWVEPSIEAFFIWQGLISVLSVAILIYQTYQLLPKSENYAHFDLMAIIKIRHFAGGMAATTLMALLLTQVDKLLLTKLITLESFGYYSLASSVAGTLLFIATPIANAILPRMTELVAKEDESTLKSTYHNSSQWLAVMIIPAGLIMSIFSEPLLQVWTGNLQLVSASAPLLSILALGTMCNGLMNTPYMLQLAYGWVFFSVRMNIIAVIIIIPALILSIPRYGALGAAWAWLILNTCYILIGIHFMHRRILIREKWYWFSNSIFKPLIFGLIISLFIHKFLVLPENRLELVLYLIGIAIIVYLTVLVSIPASRSLMKNISKYLTGLI